MTIPSTSRKAGPLLGTGAQTAWPFTFKVFAASDIAVTIADSLGIETALVLDTDYSVTLNANQETSPGGTVTYPISGTPLAVGSKLSIIGDLDYDQPLDLPSGGNFSPLALENQLDRMTMQLQQLEERLSRALLVPVNSTADVQLPNPEANELIGWDSTGDNLANYALSELATGIAYGTMRFDTFVGDGTTTQFALTEDPAALANLDVSLAGVTQVPGTDYTLTSATLVFTTAPANGVAILARYGRALPIVGPTDSSAVTHVAAGTGAVATTVQTKLRESVSVKDFGAKGDGTTNDQAAIQAAINAVSAAGGGVVRFPTGNYNLGTTGLTIYQNIVLQGDAGRYGSTTTRGVRLIYAGAANAIYGQNLLDVQIINIAVDMTTSTGSVCVGVNLNGVWKTTLRNVTVLGMSSTKGYSILMDTNTGGGTWGGQHNLLEQVECADGIIRISGSSTTDGVTTTVLNTIRGFMYEINYSQVVLINATAEGWPAGKFGYNFSNSSYATMIGCDIENSLTNVYAIVIDFTSVVREFGTIWAGFSGGNLYKMGGSGTMAPLRSYGGGLELDYYALAANTPVTLETANDVNANGYLSRQLVATNVTGGAQTGYEKKSRLINGASVVSHELLDNFRIYTTKSCATSATPVLTIPVGSSVRVRVLAYGSDPGNASNITYSQSAICNNNVGVMTVVTDTQLKSPNVAGGISFTTSSTNLIVNFANTTNTAPIFFYIDIDGPITSYTKN